VVQKVVDALVATMHWIATHSAADIANAMPPAFVSNGLTTKADYIAELAADKGQFLPDGMMPASGPPTVLSIEKFIGNVTGSVNLAATYTNQYAIAANKLEGFTK
jgi:NitT/TauT family transport system substrate-binding protein